MTPKEKAKELVGKCFDVFINDKHEHHVETAWELAKQFALIAAKEIYKLDLIPGQYPDDCKNKTSYFSYWEEVMEEI
jgi:hypothetical protein